MQCAYIPCAYTQCTSAAVAGLSAPYRRICCLQYLAVQGVVREPVQVGVAHRAAVRVELVGADLHATGRAEELVVARGGRREAAHRHKPVRVGGLGRVAADLDRVAQPG